MGLGKLLEQRARAGKDRVFLYYQDRKLTLGEIFQRVRSLAAGLVEQGLKPGDRAGIYLPNCPEAIESLLAIIYAGGTAMPLNPQWKASEIEAMLGSAGARFLILSPAAREEMKKVNRQSLSVEQFICIGDSPPEGCFAYRSYFLDKEIPAQESGDDQVAALVHTSGTTGNPKAVMLTHRNFISNFSATARFLGLNEDDLILGILPLYHVMGMAFALAPVFGAGSVGVPLPGVKLQVRNEDGEVLARDQVGELWVSGDNVMAGYWRNPEATAAVLKDGWLRTQELGYYDADGYFYIKGRKKDLIIRGGENIYPREIEEVLARHPAVAECAVLGVPDWVWGEEVMAFVVPKSGAQLSSAELGDYCHQEIADYKCPRLWKIISELPKTATGEVSKKKLHEKYRLGF